MKYKPVSEECILVLGESFHHGKLKARKQENVGEWMNIVKVTYITW